MESILMSEEMLRLYIKYRVVILKDGKYYDIENGEEIEVKIRRKEN